MAYTILRTKKGDEVQFRGECRSHPKEPVGICSAKISASGTANNIDIINVDLTEDKGTNHNVVYDVPYTKWRTRAWNDAKSQLAGAVTYGSPNATITGLNSVLQFQDSDLVTEGSIAGISTTGTSFFNQIKASGIITASYFYGDGSNLTNVGGGDTSNVSTNTLQVIGVSTLTGVLNANGGVTGDLTGNADTATYTTTAGVSTYSTTAGVSTYSTTAGVSTNSQGLTGTPNIIVGIVTATSFVGPSEVGIQSAGIQIGAGITQLNFIGAGNTFAVSGTTVDVSIGGAGNPIVSGIFTGTNLVLTLDDSSTVTIDAVKAINGTEVTIDLPNWYQQYLTPGAGFSTAGNQVGVMTITAANNPYYFGTTLKKGEEYIWSHSNTSGNAQHIGIWNGSVTYTPSLAGHNDYWTRKLQIEATKVNDVGGNYGTVGFDLSYDHSITEGATQLALRYDYTTSKLQLWDKTNEVWNLITTSSVAEDGNPVTITVAGADSTPIPNWAKREQDWEIIAQATEGANTTWRETLLHDTVVRNTRGLCKGQKMVLTMPAALVNQYLGFDYTGTTLGQTAVESQNSAKLQFTSAEKIVDRGGFTINTLATNYDSGDTTAAMQGVKFSIRYHTDNSIDIFDEDNQEVLFTKDVNGDGNPIYLHHFSSTNTTWNSDVVQNWSFEVFDQSWFVHPLTAYQPNQLITASDLSGYGSTRASWGQQLYPGEELKWEHNASSNTNIGQRNALDSGWTTRIEFTSGGIDVSSCQGFDITGSDPDVDGDVMSLRYDYGDNKLKLYNLETVGISTLITTSNDALDGNPITISLSGSSADLPDSIVHRYYGWEYIHTPTASPQLWRNWRLSRPSVNSSLKDDTVFRSLRALIPGYRFKWTTPNTADSMFIGKWKSSNAASGVTNTESNVAYWDWGFRVNTSEKVIDLLGMSFNTSNSNYNGGGPTWDDPDKGTTEIGIRYNANNSIDLYDFTNSAVIATKDSDGDGSALYIDVATGADIDDLNDNFLGGGDVDFGTV